MFSLPTTKKLACDHCKECCITFYLQPKEGFWDQLKPAGTPCKFLCEAGCSIHDQPRPNVCSEYLCGYIEGLVPWRPDSCKFIVSRASQEIAIMIQNLSDQIDLSGSGIQLSDCEPEALLRTPSAKLRYWLDKAKVRFDYVLVLPFGFNPSANGVCRRGGVLHLPFMAESEADENRAFEYAMKLEQWWKKS